MAVGLMLLGGSAWALSKLAPFIIKLAANTMVATVMGVAAFALAWVLLDRRTWIVARYSYENAMRWLTNCIVTIDPIGIMKNYVRDLHKYLEGMREQMTALNAQIRSLQQVIADNAKKAERALREASAAQQGQKRSIFVLRAKQAGRLKESNVTLEDMLKRMQALFAVLQKYAEASAVMVEDIEGEIDVKSRERTALRAGWSAMKAAKRILNGDPDKRALFEQGLEVLAMDYEQKMADIEGFIRMTAAQIDSLDVENGTYEADALATLAEWEKKGESLLLGDTKGVLLEHHLTGTIPAAAECEAVPARPVADFDRLFRPRQS